MLAASSKSILRCHRQHFCRFATLASSSEIASSLDTLPSTAPPPTTTAAATTSMMNPLPSFNNAQAAYSAKSLKDLMRAVLSLQLCQWTWLVKYAPVLHHYSRKVLGDTIVDTALSLSLFGHFCGGIDEKAIQPRIQQLEQAGIGSILDFAAEDDGSETYASENATTVERIEDENTPIVRVYNYETEKQCDQHVATFKKCIRAVQSMGKDGFAAVKITALGNPLLLEKMSRGIAETQNLFAKFDKDQDGYIGRQEFEEGFHMFFRDDYTLLKEMLNEDALFRHNTSGDVDYITWSMMLSPRHLPDITQGCRSVGPLAMATPTDEEVDLMEKMYQRGHTLAKEATACGTRLLIDAEQARFQPAIDNLVLELQRTYNANENSNIPIIYNTYQCYLRDVKDRLQVDVKRSERFAYNFGAKLVRGAYMESERELSNELGYPCPILETKEDTDKCYDEAVEFLLEESVNSKNEKIELMLATHNQSSIEKAIAGMNKYGIDRKDNTVSFGQLFGMMDNLTFGLGRHGYRAYKYVPYGEVKMVMPYLIRRANENSSLAGGAARELSMIRTELRRRIAA